MLELELPAPVVNPCAYGACNSIACAPSPDPSRLNLKGTLR